MNTNKKPFAPFEIVKVGDDVSGMANEFLFDDARPGQRRSDRLAHEFSAILLRVLVKVSLP